MSNYQTVLLLGPDLSLQPAFGGFRLRSFMCLLTSVLCIVAGTSGAAADRPVTTIENEYCRIAFDAQDGALRGITNRALSDECLKPGDTGTVPFRIFTDLKKKFEIRINEKFQLVFDDPDSVARTLFQPGQYRVTGDRCADRLILHYQAEGFEAELSVRLEEHTGTSDWSLRVTNTGVAPREFLVCFPYLDGVRLGPDPSKNLATAMDQAGLIVPAWERPGGVLGESNQFSMQWHAVWDPVSTSALGMIFMDANVRPKRLVLREPAIALHYFPTIRLEPGASVDLPTVRVLVYQGDWRPAARAYRAWYDQAYAHVEPPQWFRESNGNTGIHFRKGGESGYSGQVAFESFKELPAAHLRAPIDNWEYAFYCRTSMLTQDQAFTPHTDGDNVIRQDLGGAEAMREGIAGVHRLGLHVTLYVEGYIIPEQSDLAKTGKGKEWAIVNKDGSITGPYTRQGFYHLCPGCTGWQDHLATTVARLLRETGADAIRLDSLGFYYRACYNPAHHHETPFGYNEWLGTLLSKVRRAAISVKPDVLLLTEGPADWVGQWFHGALTSRCPRELSPMRLAVGPFRPYVYASGALWGSLSGFPGGGCSGSDIHTMDWNWLCARFPAHEALVWGDVADEDPISSDPEIVTRRFEGDGYWAVVAARPASQDPVWPRGTGVADTHREYTLTVQGIAPQVEDAAWCDIETLTWSSAPVERVGENLQVRVQSNWVLILLRKHGGPQVVAFDHLPSTARGGAVVMQLKDLSATTKTPSEFRATVNAPGLEVAPATVRVPADITVTVPNDALPGNYSVFVSGENILGAKRFLVVE